MEKRTNTLKNIIKRTDILKVYSFCIQHVDPLFTLKLRLTEKAIS